MILSAGALQKGQRIGKAVRGGQYQFAVNNGSFDSCESTSALEGSSECVIERPLHTILLAAYKDLHCSFCGKSGSEVEKLVEGPKVLICNECIRSFGSKKNPSNN